MTWVTKGLVIFWPSCLWSSETFVVIGETFDRNWALFKIKCNFSEIIGRFYDQVDLKNQAHDHFLPKSISNFLRFRRQFLTILVTFFRSSKLFIFSIILFSDFGRAFWWSISVVNFWLRRLFKFFSHFFLIMLFSNLGVLFKIKEHFY